MYKIKYIKSFQKGAKKVQDIFLKLKALQVSS